MHFQSKTLAATDIQLGWLEFGKFRKMVLRPIGLVTLAVQQGYNK